jgi:glycosyltransferase involved in cell wall biosynthesis
MKNKISLILFTHNSENKLKLERSFLDLFDELIAVDDNSTDKTLKILKDHSFNVVNIPFDGDFAARHNTAMKIAKNDWVFFLDDDEHPDNRLVDALSGLIFSNFGAYKIVRKDVAWGKIMNHGEQGNMALIRLVNRSNGQWVRKVHEFFDTDEKIARLEGSLIHDQNLTVENFLDKANFYSQIDAIELKGEGKKFSPIEMLKPKAKFIQNYILRLGFLDGYRGLFLAYLMSLQSFLVRIYQWELQK